jgi:uncharacterized protein (TIGR02453 family)
MSDFATLVPDARKFLSALAQNNNKAWWDENKPTYEAKLKKPALALIDDVSVQLAALTDLPIKGKLFRPHRDVRFSKDKTPYKTHLHMLWTAQTGARQDVAFFFGIGLDDVRAGGGIMGFDKAVLEDWRLFVDQDHKRILKITDGLKAKGFGFWEPALKRIPPGYDKDHPAGALLRMKGCVAFKDISGPGALPATFKTFWPLNQLLIQIVEA